MQLYPIGTTSSECSVEMSGSTSSQESKSFRSTIVLWDSRSSVTMLEEECFVALVGNCICFMCTQLGVFFDDIKCALICHDQ